MIQVISNRTRRGENLLAGAQTNLGDSLRKVYSSWSENKENAFYKCLKEKVDDNGTGFRITGKSCHKFTVAWEFDYVNPDTGEVTPATKIKTASNTYIVLHEEV